MAKKGYLDADQMAHTFDALRANDLVFQYVVNNWLLGKKPPAFDLLVWNNDSTRMPAKMHSQYLRSCYLHNEFARGEFEIDGVRRSTGARSTSTPTCSRRSTTTSCRGSPATRPLGCSAATTGSSSARRVTSPASSTRPAPRPSTGPTTTLPADPQEWKDNARAPGRHLVGRLGHVDRRAGRPARSLPRAQLGSKKHPPIEPAPGSYVRTRA